MAIDLEVKWALEFLSSYADKGTWASRLQAVDKYFSSISTPHSKYDPKLPLNRVVYKEDYIAWYLWLADAYLYRRFAYEFTQGARVIPYLKAMGRYQNVIQKVKGIDDRVSDLLNRRTDQADSGLFELLVAILYVRNGAEHTEFLTEQSGNKTPDLYVEMFGGEIYVECKRLSKSSQYSLQEREEWLKRWRQLSAYLIHNHLSVILDITFHVELHTLPESFILDELASKLRYIAMPSIIIQNDTWTVKAELTELRRIRQHLESNYVKYLSSSFTKLVAGRYERHKGFTAAIKARMVHFEEKSDLNKCVDDVEFASGAFWNCDATRALEIKARDIRGHLSDAILQLPNNKPCSIHIGIESLDGTYRAVF